MLSNVPARRMVRSDYTKSWKFNGISSRIVSNSTVDLSPYSKLVVDFQFYKAAGPGSTGIIAELSAVGATAGTFIVYLNNGTTIIAYLAGATGVRQWGSETLATGWHHITAVFDRTSGANIAKIFLDGFLSGALNGSTETGGGNFVNDTLNIGARNASSLWLNSNVKDLRISSFTGTWADAEALGFYAGYVPFGYTKRLEYLGEDASTTAVDSVSAQNATLTNVTYDTTIIPSAGRTLAGARTPAGSRVIVPVFTQNFITYSEDFSNAIWTKSNITVTPNAIANPINGAVDADLITDDSASANHMIHQLTSMQVIQMGEQFTYSFYIKANTNQWIFCDSVNGSVYFDLINGVLGTIAPTAGAQIFGKIEPVPNQAGWYRVSASGTCVTGLGNFFRLRMANSDGGASYAGASNKSFYLWGFQVNKGIGAAPYVQTVATAVNTGTPRTQA